MSKNKKIIILITILVIVILSIVGIFIYKNRKVDNIVIGENNKNQIQENIENVINDKNIIENTETEHVEQNNAISASQIVEESKEKETTTTIKDTTIPTKKENTTTTTTSKQQTTQEKTQSQTQTSEASSKSGQTTPSQNNDNSYQEQEVQVAPKTECVGNNHKIGAGNTGKWFATKAEADSFYNTEIEKWGKMWENDEITKEEYLKKCPSGYEVWTCPQCQKWTINFYYR